MRLRSAPAAVVVRRRIARSEALVTALYRVSEQLGPQ